jgi:transposase
MKLKSKQKIQARQLRVEGMSLRDISRTVGISKSTASLWCKDIKLSEEQISKLISRPENAKYGSLALHLKREREKAVIREEAINEIDQIDPLDLKRLKDIGTMLYWAEGGKGKCVDITNSDPEVMRLAMLWLRKICHVPEEKFRPSIYYHYNQNEEEIKQYWSEITQVPLEQFYKSIFKQEGTGHRKRILYMGTCKVRILDANLLYRILTWIKQLHLPY